MDHTLDGRCNTSLNNNPHPTKQMSQHIPNPSRRNLLKTIGVGAVASVGASTTASAGSGHPKKDIVTLHWHPGSEARGIPAGPLAIIHPNEGGGRWEVLLRHSEEYTKLIMNTHDVWERFNDFDSVESNIRLHYWARYRGDARAGIQLWEQGNPLNEDTNIDGQREVAFDDEYFSIKSATLGKNIEDEWDEVMEEW